MGKTDVAIADRQLVFSGFLPLSCNRDEIECGNETAPVGTGLAVNQEWFFRGF